MSPDRSVEGGWSDHVDQMFGDLRSGQPRALAYWAQQLAFSPTFFHAVALRIRWEEIGREDQEHLGRAVALAFSAFRALPDEGDSRSIMILAQRQALALSWNRRRQLARMAALLGVSLEEGGDVPLSMCRAYPILGWRAPGRVGRAG